MNKMAGKMIPLGGMWINRTKEGKVYMSGNLSYGAKLVMFKNEHKSKDSEPDYVLYIAPIEREASKSEGVSDEPPF